MWDIYNRTSPTASALLRLALEWDLDLYTPRGEPTRVRQDQRDGTIDHAWATRGTAIRYEGALDLPGSDHIPQLITVWTGENRNTRESRPIGYSWAMLDHHRCVAEAQYLI